MASTQINQLLQGHTGQVRIEGHSLGAAVAQLMCVHVLKIYKHLIVRCLTLGAPYISNSVLREHLDNNSWSDRFCSIINHHDIVTRLGLAPEAQVAELLRQYGGCLAQLIVGGYKEVSRQADLISFVFKLCGSAASRAQLPAQVYKAGRNHLSCLLTGPVSDEQHQQLITETAEVAEYQHTASLPASFGHTWIITDSGVYKPSSSAFADIFLSATMLLPTSPDSMRRRLLSDHRLDAYEERVRLLRTAKGGNLQAVKCYAASDSPVAVVLLDDALHSDHIRHLCAAGVHSCRC